MNVYIDLFWKKLVLLALDQSPKPSNLYVDSSYIGVLGEGSSEKYLEILEQPMLSTNP